MKKPLYPTVSDDKINSEYSPANPGVTAVKVTAVIRAVKKEIILNRFITKFIVLVIDRIGKLRSKL